MYKDTATQFGAVFGPITAQPQPTFAFYFINFESSLKHKAFTDTVHIITADRAAFYCRSLHPTVKCSSNCFDNIWSTGNKIFLCKSKCGQRHILVCIFSRLKNVCGHMNISQYLLK